MYDNLKNHYKNQQSEWIIHVFDITDPLHISAGISQFSKQGDDIYSHAQTFFPFVNSLLLYLAVLNLSNVSRSLADLCCILFYT